MINLETDELRPLSEVIRARIGRRISPATLWRWRLKGVNGVRLECVRVGGYWFTTNAAFAEFLAAQTANVLRSGLALLAEPTPTRSPEKERRLRELGLLK
jgi:hypothetical protein